MSDFGIRDVPCTSCQVGYNREHECDVPDYCPCDRANLHTPVREAEQRERPTYRTRCLSCGKGREGHDAQGKCITVKGKCITVEGRSLRMTRLDPEGQPTGDPVVVDAAATLGFEVEFPETGDTIGDVLRAKSDTSGFTIEVALRDVDPEVMALLMGRSLRERPWWWRFVPRRIRRTVKRREIRRGYGG